MAAKYLTKYNDNYWGTKKAEIVFGMKGNDNLSGQEGNDELHGGDGNDRLFGNPGADKLYGDAGNDYILGGNDKDIIWGGKGDDSIGGGSGNDTLYGGDGNDTLISGNDMNDVFDLGSTGLDNLYGGNGDDQLYSGWNMDGGAGDDFLSVRSVYANGIANSVTMTGGEGHDAFTFGPDTNGVVEVAVVNDLAADDRLLVFASGHRDFSYLEIGYGEAVDVRNISVQQRGHDIVITGGEDGDQIVLKGAADWLHLS